MNTHNKAAIEEGIRKREQVVAFIDGFIAEHGYPPTIDEIAADLGVIHKSAAKHVNKLIEQGRLTKGPGPRTLRIVDTH